VTQRGPGSLHGDAPRPQGDVRRAGAASNFSAGNALGEAAVVGTAGDAGAGDKWTLAD
jgi:hypothetical protein